MKGGRIAYSPVEMAWLFDNRMMVISDYHRGFIARFERADVTAAHLHGLRKRKGWKVGPVKGRMKGRRTLFSAQEVAWLANNCRMETQAWRDAFCARFERDVTVAQLICLRKQERWQTGRTGQFEKGTVPINKGKPAPYHPNSAATRFKPGTLSGRALELAEPIGAERIREGYLMRKVNNDLPMQARWKQVHRINWEAANGPIPEGHCLKALDGDRTNVEASNWEAIPRSLLPMLNGGRASKGPAYDQVEPELRPAVMALAKSRHRARRLKAAG